MRRTDRRKTGRKTGKKRISTVTLLVIILAVAVVAGGAGVLAVGGGAVSGKLPDFHVKDVNVSPLTGQVYEGELPARPLIVSIDNVGDAVPQSNLSKADLVYEFPVEGLQTRLQAVFYGEFPEFFEKLGEFTVEHCLEPCLQSLHRKLVDQVGL